MTARDLLDLIALRDAEDSLTRASAWIVVVRHRDFPDIITHYGPFEHIPAAMAYALDLVSDLNADGEDGFLGDVMPVLPAGDA